jgi:serine/threonine-protein kinase HipA
LSKAKLYYLHEGLPRQAPGTDYSTREAMRRLGFFPRDRRVVDVGCGPGRASILLAKELKAFVTAVDIHQPYLDHLAALCKQYGLRRRIKPIRMSMDKLKFKAGSIDLIWAEGSAYFIGIRRALELWFPLLKDYGLVMFSELCWLTDSPPVEAVAYWAKAYPQMTTSAAHVAAAQEIGYYLSNTWVLPDAHWWPDYLTPLEARMELLAPEAAKDRRLAALIADSRAAIDLFRRHSASFGYVYHVLGKPRSTPLQGPVGRFAVQPPARQETLAIVRPVGDHDEDPEADR